MAPPAAVRAAAEAWLGLLTPAAKDATMESATYAMADVLLEAVLDDPTAAADMVVAIDRRRREVGWQEPTQGV